MCTQQQGRFHYMYLTILKGKSKRIGYLETQFFKLENSLYKISDEILFKKIWIKMINHKKQYYNKKIKERKQTSKTWKIWHEGNYYQK